MHQRRAWLSVANKKVFQKNITLKFFIAIVATSVACIAYTAIISRAQAIHIFPTGSIVSSGDAVITQSGSVLTINQRSQRAVIDWSSFNVSKYVTLNIIQPKDGALLIRVNSDSASMIEGVINSSAKIVLVNANGFVFGKSAQVTAGALSTQF